MNGSGYVSNNIKNIEYQYLNGVNILPKIRMVKKGNDICYLDFYFNGNNQRGTNLYVTAISAITGSVSLYANENPQQITEISSGYYTEEFTTT